MIARVFVPLVGANGESAQVFEAIAGDVAPEAHPARLLPQISELFDFGLYGIGQTVREAVARFVDARRAKLWLGRRNGRVNSWNLRISDLQIGRLSDENARSAGPRPRAGGDLPGVRARPRRGLRDRGNQTARRSRRARRRGRPGRRPARQADAGRRLHRSAPQDARRRANDRGPAVDDAGRPFARRGRGLDHSTPENRGDRRRRGARFRLRRHAGRRRGGARSFRHARDRHAGAGDRRRRRGSARSPRLSPDGWR